MNLIDLYNFWFEEISMTPSYYSKKIPVWFMGKDITYDEQCRKFGELLNEFDRFEIEKLSNVEYLGLILLTDQIPRNIFRGTRKAYEYDLFAQKLTLKLLNTPRELEFNYVERLFLYMPLEHSENIELQKMSVDKFQEMYEKSPIAIKEYTKLALDKAIEHYSTIKQHGLFPKRFKTALPER